eukprot:scaffold776_cov178-Pinguiococcus_pyrenoidosus.AAC.1
MPAHKPAYPRHRAKHAQQRAWGDRVLPCVEAAPAILRAGRLPGHHALSVATGQGGFHPDLDQLGRCHAEEGGGELEGEAAGFVRWKTQGS